MTTVKEAVVASAIPEDIVDNEGWLVQAIDPRARLARLVRMDQSAYRQESFLDDRMLATRRESLLCDLDQLIGRSGEITAPPASWIFHIGHVGSTLISRLLGETDGVLALREPRSLRDLLAASDGERPALAAALARILARRSPDHRHVIVKATSFVSEMASLLVERGGRAIFLYTKPASYMSGILAGENSQAELEALHPVRTARLARRGALGGQFAGNHAEMAALAWACEMTSLEAAADSMPNDDILWSDFDDVLRDVAGWLSKAAGHLGISADSGRFSEIASGPLISRYSKALEYDYSPSLRAELLGEAAREHRQSIDGAIKALHDAAKSFPLLDRALRRADGEN